MGEPPDNVALSYRLSSARAAQQANAFNWSAMTSRCLQVASKFRSEKCTDFYGLMEAGQPQKVSNTLVPNFNSFGA